MGALALNTTMTAGSTIGIVVAETLLRDTCPPTQPEALRKTEALIMEKQEQPLNWRLDFDDTDSVQTERGGIAETYGLTTHDYREYFPPRSRESSAVADIPLDELVTSAQAFSALYGLGFDILKTEEHNGYGAVDTTSLNDEQVDTLKDVVHHAMMDLSLLPEEYVRTADVEGIYVADLTATPSRPAMGGVTWLERGNTKIYINYATGHNAIPHELAHAWDYSATCNYHSGPDLKFTALNPADIYITPGGFLAGEDMPVGYLPLSAEPSTEQPERVVTVNRYGATNVFEDKATIGAEVTGRHADLDDIIGVTPILEDKLTYWLAGVYAENPSLARYFVEVGFVY